MFKYKKTCKVNIIYIIKDYFNYLLIKYLILASINILGKNIINKI